MTRLSEALKRASETPATAAPPEKAASPASEWRFAPVETMHVPDEPAAAQPTRWAAAPAAAPDAIIPDAVPAVPTPVTATVPKVAQARTVQFALADRDKVVVGENADSALVEQYRHLAAALHHAQRSTGVRTVMVTSALAAEGKTLTATNVALTLSESYQRRVLLIDADLRQPRLREMFNLPMGEGLTDALTVSLGDRLPVHHAANNLWVLTAGQAMPDPMALLVSPAMKQLIDDARESFDWVIVDTPPIAILPDANLLSAMIDTTLLVVAAHSTPYPMVQRASDAIGAKRILGVVLNRAERAALSAGYGYYGYQKRETPRGRRWFGWLRRPPQPTHVQ